MAKREFLDRLRRARNLFVHRGRAPIWLTPSSVEGFNAEEFPELGPDRQRELGEAVQEFEAAARHASSSRPATESQYRAAAEAFQRVVGLLGPYLAAPREEARIRDAFAAVDFPSPVVNWDLELGSDADDHPAVWVTVFLDDDTTDHSQLGRLVLDVTTQARRALLTQGIELWPYVRVRMAAEHMAR